MTAWFWHWISTGGQVAAVLAAARLAFGLYRFVRLPKAARKNYLPAVWAKVRWRWLTRNLKLAYIDQHRRAHWWSMLTASTSVRVDGRGIKVRKLRYPRARFRADAYGIVARVRTIPGVGRAEFDKNAPHIADAWHCHRVQVSQPKPGRVIVRGLRQDPLTVPFHQVFHSGVPSRPQRGNLEQGNGTRLYLGRDEWGADRYLALRGVTGITVGGLPGYGKTSLINHWLSQLAGSAAVQFVIIDGKGGGDYTEWANRCWLYAGDELGDALGVLEDVHALMRRRFGTVLEQTGHRNAWHAGPSERFPLIVTVIDESHTFTDLDAVKGDRQAENQVRNFRAFAGQLVKKGRSVLMVTVLATQKQTSDAIPTSIRDNCGLSVCFAVKTRDAAVASLGESIRDYPSQCPTGLQDPAYVGVATASLRTGMDPYVRVRVPEVSDQAAAERAAATAQHRRDPTRTVSLSKLPTAERPALERA